MIQKWICCWGLTIIVGDQEKEMYTPEYIFFLIQINAVSLNAKNNNTWLFSELVSFNFFFAIGWKIADDGLATIPRDMKFCEKQLIRSLRRLFEY